MVCIAATVSSAPAAGGRRALGTCTSYGGSYGSSWCNSNCFHNPPNCPSSGCTCATWAAQTSPSPPPPPLSSCTHYESIWAGNTDAWCNSNCFHNPPHCPSSHCQCDAWGAQISCLTLNADPGSTYNCQNGCTSAIPGNCIIITASCDNLVNGAFRSSDLAGNPAVTVQYDTEPLVIANQAFRDTATDPLNFQMECAPGSSPSGSATCTTGTNKLPTGCDCTVRTISVNNGNWAKNTGISYTSSGMPRPLH